MTRKTLEIMESEKDLGVAMDNKLKFLTKPSQRLPKPSGFLDLEKEKTIIELRDISYEDRLRSLKLTSLAYSCRRGDMIQMYKKIHPREGKVRQHFLI